LQRIYGTAWESEAALAAHLELLAQAELRDHRKLGQELDLFSFPSEVGPGLAVFHPKGGTMRRVMEEYSRKRHEVSGYDFVYSPHITKSELFEISVTSTGSPSRCIRHGTRRWHTYYLKR